MKKLHEKRQALLTELDKADEKRTEEIRAELAKIKLQLETMQEIEAEEQRTAKPVVAQEAVRFNFASKPATEKRVSKFDTEEYRTAFMRFVRDGKAIPRTLYAKRDGDEGGTPDPVDDPLDDIVTISDSSAVIPESLSTEIISKLESYGELYGRVTKTNIKGGVRVPILTLKPAASWVDELPSVPTKVTSDDYISFGYFGLECRVYQTLLSNIVSLPQFESKFVELAVEALVKRLEVDIVNGNGTGKVLGILADTRITNAQKATLKPSEIGTWDGWHKQVISKLKKSYRKGVFVMAQATFDSFISGMVDDNGQPIARVNFGLNNEEQYRLFGKEVITVEDDVLPSFSSARENDVFAIFFDPADYVINSNLEMTVTKWVDHDLNQVKNKVMMICDGRLLDANGVVTVKKGKDA